MTTPVIDKVMDAADRAARAGGRSREDRQAHRPDGQNHEGRGQHPPAAAQGVRRPRRCTPGVRRDRDGDGGAGSPAGWINGVVGVHPYQLAYADPRVAAEIRADDVDTWVAPLRPAGGPARWTAATSSTDAGSSVPAPTTATDLPRRHDRRRRRQAADAATDAAHDPAAQGLRGRPGTWWGCGAPAPRTSSSRTRSCRPTGPWTRSR